MCQSVRIQAPAFYVAAAAVTSGPTRLRRSAEGPPGTDTHVQASPHAADTSWARVIVGQQGPAHMHTSTGVGACAQRSLSQGPPILHASCLAHHAQGGGCARVFVAQPDCGVPPPGHTRRGRRVFRATCSGGRGWRSRRISALVRVVEECCDSAAPRVSNSLHWMEPNAAPHRMEPSAA